MFILVLDNVRAESGEFDCRVRLRLAAGSTGSSFSEPLTDRHHIIDQPIKRQLLRLTSVQNHSGSGSSSSGNEQPTRSSGRSRLNSRYDDQRQEWKSKHQQGAVHILQTTLAHRRRYHSRGISTQTMHQRSEWLLVETTNGETMMMIRRHVSRCIDVSSRRPRRQTTGWRRRRRRRRPPHRLPMSVKCPFAR